MKDVSQLYNRHPGNDIYVVGTGVSLRVFPLSFLEGKITIGLNMAWKMVPVRYGITIHPDLNIPEFMDGEKRHPEITWVTKLRKLKGLRPDYQEYAKESFYLFETDGRENTQPPDQPSDEGRILDWVRQPVTNRLYQWSSISQTAVNLAANMGAKNIVLVGCDNCSILENHHAHFQHTRWKGINPEIRYQQYYEGLAEVREILREREINVVNVSPFLGIKSPERDFFKLCKELGKETFIHSVDISPRMRIFKKWKADCQRAAGMILKLFGKP